MARVPYAGRAWDVVEATAWGVGAEWLLDGVPELLRVDDVPEEFVARDDFTWPAKFPVARIDQILVKGVEPVNSRTLPATGSDHLPIAAAINF